MSDELLKELENYCLWIIVMEELREELADCGNMKEDCRECGEGCYEG